ncbi:MULTISPECIES: type II toxin-antitoxin system RelE/ParE family toxin [unclassified Butyrivibrio]|uniref:type II toxin-antitoxin system RelE/ParE family toxin n=1 Tax=unclassified Butyrivibrio TaxID=2639466 RepID=UPI0003B3BA6E|nr:MULTISPECIES: type II toxin-antitoxin system RelE/ParE family toxin [unclassified Butyrivibrio]MDC7294557.1 type II toxin-antitoxin system RelE/ParE family toxin [Butyrivibrio sp. DSM 10294]
MIVEFYKLEDGTKPAGIFIKSIEDNKLKAKVIRSTKLLEEFGTSLSEPDSKMLEDGIFELRSIQGKDIARCLYFFTVGDKAIVTNGLIKKTEKTPRSAIALAKKYRSDYERRIKDGRY